MALEGPLDSTNPESDHPSPSVGCWDRPTGYHYDVFLSYSREDPVKMWVNTHFHPNLGSWLSESLGRKAVVFLDSTSATTGFWPDNVKEALLRSCILVPVLSPRYFQRPWCLAEWNTMLRRANQSRLTLVCPVWFFDGDRFPPQAHDLGYCDLRNFNFPHPGYADNKNYSDFVRMVQIFSETLFGVLTRVPPWDPDFPIVTPGPPPGSPMGLPRLGA
jgi:hypothetical protein